MNVLQIGKLCVTNWGSFVLLQIRANVVTNWGSYYKLRQPLLQYRAAITNWGKIYYKLWQVLQIRAIITSWGITNAFRSNENLKIATSNGLERVFVIFLVFLTIICSFINIIEHFLKNPPENLA